MSPEKLLGALEVAGRLKDVMRHSWTAKGRRESTAEHTFRTALFAYFLKDEFPEADIDKVILMCLIHDLGEAFTGDIPSFEKTALDEEKEVDMLSGWVLSLPEPYSSEMGALYTEMAEMKTVEAKLYKAIDNLEAVITHNEADLSTWIRKEYTLNLTYGDERVADFPYLIEFRRLIRDITEEKIRNADYSRQCEEAEKRG
ncbi:MAG: HD domain-containing protein [Clostridia bacterium]|nr:HD domain-containing protein [Clostridia bacterium]